MKKIFTLVGLVALMAGFTACTKSQTELSGDTLDTSVTVSGHVRYISYGKSGAEDPEIADPGTPVNIYYGVPEGGKVQYAVKTLKVNADGFFQTKIGCPPGQALEVKASASMNGNSYTIDENGKQVDSDAYFFGEVKKTVACGSATYLLVDMVPVAYTSEPGLKQ